MQSKGIMLNSPVALFFYKRPDATKQVMARIREVRPQTLLLATDSPAPGASEELIDQCNLTKQIVETSIDWQCDVRRNYSESHLGAHAGLIDSLNWVFREVEEAIILEDDCLPDTSFFRYCEIVLEHFRDDARIMHISGENYAFSEEIHRASYHFSKYALTWGWATWARAWKFFDLTYPAWPVLRDSPDFRALFNNKDEYEYWRGAFDAEVSRPIKNWDYAWMYACLVQSGLAIHPGVNLISNIGFGKDAVNTKWDSAVHCRATHHLREINHPDVLIRDQKVERQIFDRRFPGEAIRKTKTIYHRVTQPARKLKYWLKTRSRNGTSLQPIE